MFLRNCLIAALVTFMASPAWSAGEPVGSISSSANATVRETPLRQGSTVFSGDAISVGENGAARIALAGGAQAEVLGNSQVKLAKSGDTIQMILESGQASFQTSSGIAGAMEGLVAGVTVRPADGKGSSAILQVLNERHVMIAAQKGSLLLTTARDARIYTIPEGSAADLTAAPEGPQDRDRDRGAVPAGKSLPRVSPPSKHVIWIVAIVGGATLITAFLLARREPKQSKQDLQNEISPFKLQ